MVVYSLGKIAFVVASFLLLFRIFIIIFRYHYLSLVGKVRWGPWSLLKIEFTLLPITVFFPAMLKIPPPPPAFVLMSMSILVSKASTTMWAGEWDFSADMVHSLKVVTDQISKSKPLLSYWPWLRIGRGNGHPSPGPYCPTDHGKGLDGFTHCDSSQGYHTRP